MIVRISEACRNEIRSSVIPVRRCRRRPVRLIRSSGHPSTNRCPCSPLTIISEILENSRVREKSLVNRFMIVKFATAAPRTIAVHRFNVSLARIRLPSATPVHESTDGLTHVVSQATSPRA